MMANLFLLLCLALLGMLYSGLAFLYTGSLRKKYALSPLIQALVVLGSVFLGWELFYSKLIWSSSWMGLLGNPARELVVQSANISTPLFSLFHAFFCAIAVYLVYGSVLERLRLKGAIILAFLWPLLVYVPIAHWVWNPEGFLLKLGSVDFAGGIVVHISSGVSALVLAISCGRRKDYFGYRPRSDQRMIFLGVIFILLGWCGFNGGSAMEFNKTAISAIYATWLVGMSSIFSGFVVEYAHTPHRVSLSHISLSMISGLVMVTPVADQITTVGAILIGLSAGPLMFYAHKVFHHTFKVDDGLDVFISHGVSGLLGALITGLLLGKHTLWANVGASIAVIVYSSCMTWIIIRLTKLLFGIDFSHHLEGMDISDHGENVVELSDQ